jgi:hypothetical protein
MKECPIRPHMIVQALKEKEEKEKEAKAKGTKKGK